MMMKSVSGTINSSNISNMGKTKYGYLGIQTDDNEQFKVKVTAFTKYDTLDIGQKVLIDIESVGDDKILTARSIKVE